MLGGRRSGRLAGGLSLAEAHAAVRGLTSGPESVVVRPLREGDEGSWSRLRLADDERLAPWEAGLPPGSGEALRSFRAYVRHTRSEARSGRSLQLVVEADGALAGQIGVEPIVWGATRSASIGYWIGSAWEGTGTAGLAVAMVIDALLGEEIGLHRVEACVVPDNLRSLALCRRLGLREEGIRERWMFIDGEWRDHRCFARTSEEARQRGPIVPTLVRM